MPELPEVETVRRTLEPHVVGRRILTARFLSPLAADGHPIRTATRLSGNRILALTRHGKHLLFALELGWLHVHLRMTGKLLVGGTVGPFTRAILELEHTTLLFDDVRQFGRLLWSPGYPARVTELGPDALGLTVEQFIERLKVRRGGVKAALLDQEVIAGLGNIYVDESLHRAGIHPLASLQRLGARRLGRLHAAVVEVLGEAVAAGGSSISDYVDAAGETGWFQINHRVYGRAGEPCPACGAAVKRILVGQRGTHFCPRCQRK
jgi:formamidopyrimidine-DNA glycosylase